MIVQRTYCHYSDSISNCRVVACHGQDSKKLGNWLLFYGCTLELVNSLCCSMFFEVYVDGKKIYHFHLPKGLKVKFLVESNRVNVSYDNYIK